MLSSNPFSAAALTSQDLQCQCHPGSKRTDTTKVGKSAVDREGALVEAMRRALGAVRFHSFEKQISGPRKMRTNRVCAIGSI